MATGMVEGVAGWRRFCRSLRETQAHATWLTTSDAAQASTLSLLAYSQLTQPVYAFLYPARHTCPTPLCQPNHAPTLIWGASQLPWRCPQPTAPTYYTTAGEWIASTRHSLCRWHCPVIPPTALPALLAILRRTISPCTCVSVCECELWNRDGISWRDGNVRPTCLMMILIWTSITIEYPNFSYPHKNPLHCRVHVPVEAVRVAD